MTAPFNFLKRFAPFLGWTALNALILTLAAYLRFDTLAHRTLWIDETEQLRALQRSLKDLLFHYLPRIPGGFPGDYLLTWPIAQVTSNKWILTAPHILATFAAFAFFLEIRREDRGQAFATSVALLMMGLNRNLVFHDFEFRPYGVLPALALGSYWGMNRTLRFQTWTGQDVIVWCLWVFSVLLFHSYGVLILGCFMLFHIVKSLSTSGVSRAPLWRLFGVTMLAGILALPVWRFFARVSDFDHDPFAFCRASISGVLAFFWGNLGDWGWRFSWVPGALLLVTSCFLIKRPGWKEHLLFILVVLVLPLTVIFASDVRCRYWIVQRQFTWAMPLWALAVARSLDLWWAAANGKAKAS